MSDSDDTDILLLIPPDFFLVDSSDVDSIGHGDSDSLVERTVVNDLISHVNELENRIAEIERKDDSLLKLNDSSSSLSTFDSFNPPHAEMNPTNRHFGSSSSLNTSPSRRVSRFNSLPPTPSSSSYRSFAPSVSTSRTWGRSHNSPPKTPSRSNRNLFDSSWESTSREKPKENELLTEVDRFLDGLKRDSSASKSSREKELVSGALPPSPQKKDTADGVARLQLDEVDRLLKEVEAEQKNIEARLGSHEAPEVRRIVRKPGEDIGSIPDLGFGVRAQWKDVDRFLQSERNAQPAKPFSAKQQPVEEPIVTARNQYKLGDNVGSIPNLGLGVREAWTPVSSASKQAKPSLSAESTRDQGVEPPIISKTAATLHSEMDPTPKQTPKVFASRRKLDLESHANQAPNVEDAVELDTATSLDSFPSSTDQIGAVRNKRAVAQPSTGKHTQNYDVGTSKTLPSLAELWSDGEQGAARSVGDTKLLQKYEEELCRRQHCEQLVQALQAKLLESQQKMAVALQVDCEKDAAIAKLQGAWNSLADHWRSVEDQRHNLTKQLQDHKLQSETQLKQMQEKMERYETELSKALDLAHGYKEQSESAERIHSSQMEQLASKAHELEHRLALATQACNNAQQREETLQAQINEDHIKLTQLQTAMDAAAKALTTHEADIAVLAEEKKALQTRLKEEKSRLDTQLQSRDKLSTELEESIKREKNLQIELRKSSEQQEAMKTELHDFYQAQLERVVREKLKEFQSQLDAAEATLQRELESRERSVAQLAARQLQHVTEKHKLEVSLLEQKHSEELRLVQLQLAKAARQIQDQESRLAAHEKRSSTLAERLHGVMESQWREALNIISNPNDSSGRSDSVALKPEKQKEKMNDTAWMLVQQQQKSQSQCSSRSSADEAPFSREGQITHRTATPVQQEESDELRRYIKMLLDRAPGNPVANALEQERTHSAAKSSSGGTNNSLQLKPPWK